MGMSGQHHVTAALPPGKEAPVPIGQEVGWTPEPGWTTWRREKYCPTGIRTPAIQPISRRYTDSNINMDVGEIGSCGMDWIDLAHDTDQWRALVNRVMNLWVPQHFGKFMSSCATEGWKDSRNS
jgi:hypothetical protein